MKFKLEYGGGMMKTQSTGTSVKKIAWNGTLPIRRYAIFNSILYGDYAIVVKGDDIDSAEKWGGFVSWLGGTKGGNQSCMELRSRNENHCGYVEFH